MGNSNAKDEIHVSLVNVIAQEYAMAKLRTERLRRDLKESSFDCGNIGINEQIRESYYLDLLRYVHAFEIFVDNKSVGFYQIGFRRIYLSSCPEDISDYSAAGIDWCFSLNVQYIAIDKNYQGCGIGSMVLLSILNKARVLSMNYPVRLVTLLAVRERVQWYKDRGFKMFDESEIENLHNHEIDMYIDLLSVSNKEKIEEYCYQNSNTV